MAQTKDFYKSLGFEVLWEKEGCPVYFKQKNIVIESWEDPDAPTGHGAWLHVSIDVSDIEAVLSCLKKGGYKITVGMEGPKRDKFLTERGVACVMIEGPNGETIEFNEIF